MTRLDPYKSQERYLKWKEQAKEWKLFKTARKDWTKRKFSQIYDKSWNPQVQNYYIVTPNSSNLFDKLTKRTKSVCNADLLVEDIMSSFQIIELKSHIYNYDFSERWVKKAFKGTMKLTKSNIAKLNKSNKDFLEEFMQKKLDIRLKIPLCTVNNGEYFNMKDILIDSRYFWNFLDYFYSEMDAIMRFTVEVQRTADQPDKGIIYEFNRLIDKTSSLFISIAEEARYSLSQSFMDQVRISEKEHKSVK